MSDVPTDSPKVATIQVSADDERGLEAFAEEVKEAILAAGVAKRATYLAGYYLVDGQPIRSDGTHALTGEDATEKDERPKKKTAKKATPKKQHDGTEDQGHEHSTNDQDHESYEANEKADAVRATAKKVAKSTKRVSMRKGGDEVATETESTT